MIIRNLDASGDWVFGQGVQDYLADEPAIELNAATRLRCFLADAFWATQVGIDWWNLLGSRSPGARAAIVLACRANLAESYGIVRLNAVNAVVDPRTRHLRVDYNVDTIFSRSIGGSIQS